MVENPPSTIIQNSPGRAPRQLNSQSLVLRIAIGKAQVTHRIAELENNWLCFQWLADLGPVRFFLVFINSDRRQCRIE